MLTRSEHQLNERLERLSKQGLFPLPKRDYTQKYKYFARMINSSMGRKILLRTLPVINHQP